MLWADSRSCTDCCVARKRESLTLKCMGLKLDFRFRCLFPQMALLSNSCLSNCRCLHRDSGSIRGLEIRAQIAIKKGTELSIQYNTLVLGHRKRRQLFRKGQSKLATLCTIEIILSNVNLFGGLKLANKNISRNALWSIRILRIVI